MVWCSECSSDSFKPSHMCNSNVVFIHVLLRLMSDVELEAFGVWPHCMPKLWQSFGIRTVAMLRVRRAAAGASRSWNCFTVRGCHLPKAKLDTQYCNFFACVGVSLMISNLRQGYTNIGRYVVLKTKFCTMAPNTVCPQCGTCFVSSFWHLEF
jgi:hypothetical protein